MNKKIRVGIIGVSAERGWASVAHIPALKNLPQYELAAVSNRDKAVAENAAEAFGVPHAFGSTSELVNSPDVDLVVVTVKVPMHKELVTAAIEAGKDVFCEWPLGNGLEESETLAALAKRKGVRTAIGLQSRVVPAVNYIKDLVQQGYVGEVLSTSMVGSGILYGAFTEQSAAYAMDKKSGAGMMYSTFGNSIDALCYSLGEFRELSATVANRRKTTTIIETGESIPMNVHDQIAVSGVLENGAVATVHYRGGMSKGTNFYWEINGTKGDLVITADGGHPGVFGLTIKGSTDGQDAMESLSVPANYHSANKEGLSEIAANVAENYLRFATDLNEGTHLSATFDDALIRHRMLHAIEMSAATGTRQSYL
ncbi:Gfo/Idh/MocA family protein [Taibaiella soli]|uniref:Gfo/Idh/MocA family oxidoreductase n=1 Tax=Taibaiella soli TaxID=1649169 RepID=A0A2W2B9Y1_9BACT|nr:Gfo/Idh/MocA family oxidoreductase [Taibaiella soli]PZF72707.1 gfo/Idh/MocA family oxidoreductase [Taibaiella soli]